MEEKPLHEAEIKNPLSITEGLKGWGESEIGMIALEKGEEIKKLMGTV
jgi:hypothetical protein